jgi:hypothetical protein
MSRIIHAATTYVDGNESGTPPKAGRTRVCKDEASEEPQRRTPVL